MTAEKTAARNGRQGQKRRRQRSPGKNQEARRRHCRAAKGDHDHAGSRPTKNGEAAQKKIKDHEQRVASLTVINKKLTGELDEKTRVSFEVPDGEVRWVDHLGKRVWISLGEADGLKPRTTFSVYKKSHSGVGRGTEKGQIGGEDIKGAIEITRVLEPNLSEARIVEEDIYAPIAKGRPDLFSVVELGTRRGIFDRRHHGPRRRRQGRPRSA